MHSIASMMQRLRDNPGRFGLLNANGWFVTKHALGIYSTTPCADPWRREHPSTYQDAISDAAHPAFSESPEGAGTIETYTVLHDRKGVERGLESDAWQTAPASWRKHPMMQNCCRK